MTLTIHGQQLVYQGSKAEIAAYVVLPPDTRGLATDTKELGWFDGTNWHWIPTAVPDATYLRLDTSNDPLTAGLSIVGSADEVQLSVKSNVTQVANLQEWKDSTGAVLAVLDHRGWLGIGHSPPSYVIDIRYTAPASTIIGIGVKGTYTGGNVGSANRAVYFGVGNGDADASNYTSIYAGLFETHCGFDMVAGAKTWTGVITTAGGFIGYVFNDSLAAGIIINATGIESSVQNSATGIIRSAIGYKINKVYATGTDPGPGSTYYHWSAGMFISGPILATGGYLNRSYTILSVDPSPTIHYGRVFLGTFNTASAPPLNVPIPSETLEVHGRIKADAFIGNGRFISPISANQVDLIENSNIPKRTVSAFAPRSPSTGDFWIDIS